jgi:signal peptidase I
MKLGIGAIPHNLIIKSGGYTYYPLNQFEIDGTVAVELYRQDSDGEKKKIFIFKGTKNELSEFKKRYPVKAKKKYFYRQKKYPYDKLELNDPEILKLKPSNIKKLYYSESIDMDPNKPLFALAENLSEEAAKFNEKIKTGGTLTLNESIAAGKKMLLKSYEIKWTDKPANKVVVGDYISVPAYTFKVQYIKELLNEYLLISGYGQAIKVKNNKILTTYTKKRDHSIQDLRPKTVFETKPIAAKKTKLPAVKKVATKSPAVKKAKSPAVKKPAVKKVAVKKVATKKPAAVKKVTTKKSPLRQTGSSNKKYDERFNAMKPGKRTSASGNVYYERRADRTDKGKKL